MTLVLNSMHNPANLMWDTKLDCKRKQCVKDHNHYNEQYSSLNRLKPIIFNERRVDPTANMMTSSWTVFTLQKNSKPQGHV